MRDDGPMTILGAVCRPQLPPERLRALARVADTAGLEELWLWEDCFWGSGIATASAVLGWTDRLRVGVGLLPVPLRNVALAAMEIATLHRLFPGRVDIGVGHGVQDWMEQVGARVESPVTLLREHLAALRALLRGDTVSVVGRYVHLDQVALDWPPASPPAVLAGATGPRSLRLCGEAADGTILVAGTTPDGIREARRLVDQGRAAGGGGDPGGPAGGGRGPGGRGPPRSRIRCPPTSSPRPVPTRGRGSPPICDARAASRSRSSSWPATHPPSPTPCTAGRTRAPTPWSCNRPSTTRTRRPSSASPRSRSARWSADGRLAAPAARAARPAAAGGGAGHHGVGAGIGGVAADRSRRFRPLGRRAGERARPSTSRAAERPSEAGARPDSGTPVPRA